MKPLQRAHITAERQTIATVADDASDITCVCARARVSRGGGGCTGQSTCDLAESGWQQRGSANAHSTTAAAAAHPIGSSSGGGESSLAAVSLLAHLACHHYIAPKTLIATVGTL